MEFEWDDKKAEANLKKHGVRFRDASTVLILDDSVITILDEHPDEERYVAIGMSSLGQILVVVYTWRGNKIRIISARKATNTEQSRYFQQNYERRI